MATIFISLTLNNRSLTDYFVTLSNKLAEKHRVVIIADKIEEHPFKISPQIDVFKWPSARPTKFRDFIFLSSKVRKYKPDVMISMYGAVNIFLLVGFAFNVRHRITWYHTISSAMITPWALKIRKKYIFKLATKFYANSICSKEDLHTCFDVPLNKIDVAYNAIRLDVNSMRPVDPNKIVYAGRLHFTKGVDTLIAAMPDVLAEFPLTKLIIIGGHLTGNVIKSYIEMAEKLNIAESVEFKGYLPSEIVKKEFSDAYVTVLPSLFEAFGYVVIESFSVNTPVIGSNTSGIAEIIRDGVDGYLFEPGNEKNLAEKIIHLQQHPEKREVFSKNCLQRVKDKFEIEKITDHLFSEIDSLK